jgi:cystathionine gamma-synthase
MKQAIWCECPSNPLLWTPDLQRIRRLADQYDLAVIVDDTIGSSANVDVSSAADVVVTSLTKSFSGLQMLWLEGMVPNLSQTPLSDKWKQRHTQPQLPLLPRFQEVDYYIIYEQSLHK